MKKSNHETTMIDLLESGFNLEHDENRKAETLLDAEPEAIEGASEKALAFQKAIERYNEEIDLETAKIAEYEQAVQTTLKLLNEEEKATQLESWASTDKPVIACLHNGGTYALTSVSRDKDTGYMNISGKAAIVDLKDLWMVKKEAFAEKNWVLFAEAANVAIRDYIASIMGIKVFTEKLAKFKLSASASVLGITAKDMKTAKGTKIALQKVVNSILGTGYEVTTEDAEAFRYNYSQWGNKSITSVSMCIESNFRKQLTRLLYRIVNEAEYIGE